MRKIISMRDCLTDPEFLGHPDLLGGPSWSGWRVILIAALGEELTIEERIVFHELTGRDHEPGVVVKELWAIVGRRGGKSRAIACLAAYLAGCIDHRGILAAGQLGTVIVISASRDQAGEIHAYAKGVFATSPYFAKLLAKEPTADTIELRSRVEISVKASASRRLRGFTAVAAIGDEVAFWSSETSADPDKEILQALKPSLLTTGGPLLLISSPYGKRGEVYRTFTRHYGPDGDPRILVVRAPSKVLNPSLPDDDIAKAYEDDPVSAACEYGAEFRSDADAFVSDEVVDPLILRGVFEIPPSEKGGFTGFVDAASGSGKDSMTLGIAFTEGRIATLACVVERKPRFDPEAVTAEFAEVLKRYRIATVTGDRWAAGFVEAAFRRNGISYKASERSKSDIYREVMPMLNAGQVRLLDNAKLRAQLLGLARFTTRGGGKDTIDHAPGGHDDLANAACGALVNAGTKQPLIISDEAMAWARGDGRRSFGMGRLG